MRAKTLKKKTKQTGLLFYAWVRINEDSLHLVDVKRCDVMRMLDLIPPEDWVRCYIAGNSVYLGRLKPPHQTPDVTYVF